MGESVVVAVVANSWIHLVSLGSFLAWLSYQLVVELYLSQGLLKPLLRLSWGKQRADLRMGLKQGAIGICLISPDSIVSELPILFNLF